MVLSDALNCRAGGVLPRSARSCRWSGRTCFAYRLESLGLWNAHQMTRTKEHRAPGPSSSWREVLRLALLLLFPVVCLAATFLTTGALSRWATVAAILYLTILYLWETWQFRRHGGQVDRASR